MNEVFSAKLQKKHSLVWLFLGMLVYKFSMDLGYLYRSTITLDPAYPMSFNPLKYALGIFWCILLFAAIRHMERKVSSFFLYLLFLFQIVPITSIYALNNDSSIYYNVLCLSFLLCELLAGYTGERTIFRRNLPISRTMTMCYTVVVILLIIYIIAKNGAPHLSLLNIYTVYEYRTSGALQINKYMSYILKWVAFVIIPFAIAKTLTDRRYWTAGLSLGILLLIYLYTGMKGYLFAIPLVFVCSLWARRKNCYQEIFLLGCGGFSILTLLAYFTQPGSLWYYIFSLFGNRVFLCPAKNKFLYYDYFLSHPKMGIYGIFPSWIFNISSYYENIAYTFDISAIYYNAPEMNSNTGFFAEGFMRFGHIGTVLLLLFFALLLKQIDHFQERAGYPLTIGLFVFPIFVLSDGHLLDSLVFGPWMILAALLLFYTPRQTPLDP